MCTETDGPMRDMEGKIIHVNKIIMPFLSPEHRNSDAGPQAGMLKNSPEMNNGLKNTTERSTGTLVETAVIKRDTWIRAGITDTWVSVCSSCCTSLGLLT